MSKKTRIILLVSIIAVASFLRLWQLNAIPPGLYPDVAINGNDALDVINTHTPKVFFPENNGREGLFINLIALSFIIFGPSIWAIKIVAAIIGILTVPGLYLLSKEIFRHTRFSEKQAETVSLLSAFFLTTSFWHIHFSRIGFRAICIPLILVFSFYFLFKAFRTRRILPAVIGGGIFGLGFYTYTSFRFAVLLLLIVLIYWLVQCLKSRETKTYLKLGSAFLIAVFVIAIPIGIYFLQHPSDFIGRAEGVSIFTKNNPVMAFGISVLTHLAMFNFKGDYNWRHNYSGQPMLPFLLGITFVLGLIYSAINLFKKKDTILHLFVFSGFLIMLLPGMLTVESIPHSLRVVGVIPFVYFFAGLGSWKAYEFLSSNSQKKKIVIACSIFFLVSIGVSEPKKYFYYWAENPEVKNAFSENYLLIGNYLNSLPDDVVKYVVVNLQGAAVPFPNGLPMPAQTPMFIERAKFGKIRATYIEPKDIKKIVAGNKKIAIIPLQIGSDISLKIYETLPVARIEINRDFWVYKINF